MVENRYQDIEDLLFKGFIPLKLRVGSFDFVFKSVTDLEYEKIVLMSGLKSKKDLYTFNFHLNFFFHSIFLVNGGNFLKNRESLYLEFLDIIKKTPSKFMYQLFEKLNNLASRQNDCVKLIDSYFYESISRYNWFCKRGKHINSSLITGIEGTDNLGLNQFQKYWTVYNLREDQKEKFEENYSLAKFLASFTDGKAVKKINTLDDRKKEEEESRKKRILEFGNDPEAYEKKYLSKPTDTREQLIDSLERQVKGEKDQHDLVIEEYEKKLREDMYKQMKELKKMKEERRRDEDFFTEEVRVISSEEMRKRIETKQNRPKYYMTGNDSEDSTKYFDMSNVTDKEVIEESKIMSKEEFNDLVKDEMFSGKYKTLEESEKENELIKKQKIMSSELNEVSSKDANFPNLRNR